MTKAIIHEFDPVIYPYKLWVIIAKDPDIIEEKFDEYTGGRIVFVPGDVDRSEAFAMPVSRKENPKFGVIVCNIAGSSGEPRGLISREDGIVTRTRN
jgi:hypothetical protein